MADTKLVNMKLDPDEREHYGPSMVVSAPQYPYGLALHLDDDVMEKLALAKTPGAGKTVTIEAKAIVTSVTENERVNELTGLKSSETCMSLQITDLAILTAKGDAADKIYAKD